jgi:hypothetical protein
MKGAPEIKTTDFSRLNFFPILFHDVFPPDPVQVGLKGIGPGLSTTFGAGKYLFELSSGLDLQSIPLRIGFNFADKLLLAVAVNAALTWFKGWNRELLLGCTVIMSMSLSF